MKILLRILASPFVLALMVIAHTYFVLRRWVDFLRFGGEFIQYSKDDSDTIHKIYMELKNGQDFTSA